MTPTDSASLKRRLSKALNASLGDARLREDAPALVERRNLLDNGRMQPLDAVRRDIHQAMLRDRHRFRRRVDSLSRARTDRRRGEASIEQQIAKLAADLQRSIDTANRRREKLPSVQFDAALPVVERKDEIAEAIRDHQVVVICGETGSGKSTQLPKICLDMGRGVHGLIGHTQPRRIAARSVAARVAEELGSPLGRDVGYKVRFADETGPNTFIKLMTDGILLAESQNDRFFEQYDTIIIDEAHERSLNIDFLLGMLKRVAKKRRELKLIITSATIDAQRFAEHFSVNNAPAPVIEVSGRTYPIDIRYRPVLEGDDAEEVEADASANSFSDPDWQRAVTRAVDEVARIDTGDILIFMPTERDIHETAKILRGHRIAGDTPSRQTEIMPLYARLSAAQQQKVFKPHPHRRIVIATNVAESSLTVPGVRYVIDPGTARISRYSARSKTQRLPIEKVSRASADQRAGRCGRVGPGVCIRLFSEDDYASRDRYTTPEIQRTNLASVILQTKALNLGAIERFPFMEPPRQAAIKDGYRTLVELGAIDDQQELTEIGRKLARLPVDPRIGRIILAADEEDCLSEMLIIASVLEIQDPRERPIDKRAEADAAHAQFQDPKSDFLAYLKLWDFYHEIKQKLSRGQLRKACKTNFLSYNRMREWSDIHHQLLQLAHETKLTTRPRKDEYDAIHRAILAGFLSNTAHRGETREYDVAGGGKGFLWPGSGLMKKKDAADDQPAHKKRKQGESQGQPRWLVSAEVVETTRRYLRTGGQIRPEWVETIAPHLITRKYSEARWSRERGTVVADERVTLFGLTIIPRRSVRYGPINAKLARELFIRHALVEGEFDTEIDFVVHNQRLLDELERTQAKLRQHDLLRGDWARFQFYDERLPDDVFDAATLRAWWKQARRENPERMFMTVADLTEEEVETDIGERFPDAIPTATHDAPLEYRFEPGEDEDGVTITIPLEGLGQLDARRLGWLVPGLLEQKIIAMIRSLPKPIRRTLVPVPDTAKKVLGMIEFGNGAIEQAVAEAVTKLAGARVSSADFQLDKLPGDLRMNVRVVDEDGDTLRAGRDLDELRRELGAEASETFQAIDDPQWTRDGLTTWDFEAFPREVEVQRGGMRLIAYPMLIDNGDSVSLRLSDSEHKAARQTRRGLMRLFFFAAKRDLRTQANWLPNIDRLILLTRTLPEFDFKQHVTELMADRAFDAEETPPRSREVFDARVAKGKNRIPPAVQDVTKLIGPLVDTYHEATLAVSKAPKHWEAAAADARSQIKQLTAPGFLIDTPWKWLQQYPRFFKAIAERFDKLRAGGGDKDRDATFELGAYRDRYDQRRTEHERVGTVDPELETFRWMLEEYRVSLFAQRLGTSIKISSTRLEKQWDKVQA